MGRSWEEHGTCARAQTSTHVGIYNKSAQRCAPHGFIDLNIFVHTQILRFGRTQCFREGFTQSFINEAPGPFLKFCVVFHFAAAKQNMCRRYCVTQAHYCSCYNWV